MALLSDINSSLVETFLAVRNAPEAVHEIATSYPGDESSYYKIRAADSTHFTPTERAARFIYLNRHCFNGLYRTNASGAFNVPYARAGSGNFPTKEQFRSASHALQAAQISCCDFEDTLRDTRPGDFVYLDPPYAVANSNIFYQYGPDSFGLHDFERLRRCLKIVHKRKAYFVISYAFCPEAVDLLKEWTMEIVSVQRHIAGFVGHRRLAQELIVTNLR
jgi:DNA adenine methylase